MHNYSACSKGAQDKVENLLEVWETDIVTAGAAVQYIGLNGTYGLERGIRTVEQQREFSAKGEKRRRSQGRDSH